MKTPEAKVKERARKQLAQFPLCYVVTPSTGGYGVSGAPDIIACIDGKFFGIECKAGNKQVTDLQAIHLAKIQSAGGFICVINEVNVDNLADWVRSCLKG